MSRINFIQLAIIAVAAILRFFQLGNVPASLNWDENSNAYNAYSILRTGSDEYGNFLPLFNRSFDDYKPPLYMYLNIPTVAIFGLTPFAARLPSAILGTLCIPLIYLLAKKIFENNKYVPLIAAGLMAASPWSIQFSRVGFEANVGLFFTLATICALVYSQKLPKLLLVAATAAGLTFYSYHSQRVLTPLILIGFAAIYRKQILKIPKKYLVASAALLILITIPLAIFSPKESISKRFEATSLDTTVKNNKKAVELIEQDKETNFPIGNIIHNRRIITILSYAKNHAAHFSANFLFIEGDDNFRHHIKGMGQLYLFELPLILLALFAIAKEISASKLFVLFLLLVAPIAAAPSHPAPHAVRSFPMIIPLTLLSAYGATILFSLKHKYAKIIVSIFVIWVICSVFLYVHNYFSHYPKNETSSWQYGYAEAARATEELKSNYEKVYIDSSLEQAYIFWLYSLQYDPSIYQAQSPNRNFDKYLFDAGVPTKPTELFVTTAAKLPSGFKIVRTINYPNGEPAITISHQ